MIITIMETPPLELKVMGDGQVWYIAVQNVAKAAATSEANAASSAANAADSALTAADSATAAATSEANAATSEANAADSASAAATSEANAADSALAAADSATAAATSEANAATSEANAADSASAAATSEANAATSEANAADSASAAATSEANAADSASAAATSEANAADSALAAADSATAAATSEANAATSEANAADSASAAATSEANAATSEANAADSASAAATSEANAANSAAAAADAAAEAIAASDAAAAVASHEATYDHTGYDAHIASTANPHDVTAAQTGAYTKAEVDSAISTSSAADRDRANHVGTQPLSTISDAGTAAYTDIGIGPNQIATNEQSIGKDDEHIRLDLYAFDSPGANVPQVIKLVENSATLQILNGTISAGHTSAVVAGAYQLRVLAGAGTTGQLRVGASLGIGNTGVTNARLVTFTHGGKSWVGIELSGTTSTWYPNKWVFDGYYAGPINLEAVALADVTNLAPFDDAQTHVHHSGRHVFDHIDLPAGAIPPPELGDLSVANSHIQDDAVTARNLATGTQERDWVLARTAAAAYGAVGTYAFCSVYGTAIGEGGVLPGSRLLPAGLSTIALVGADSSVVAEMTHGGNILSGSWRIMGRVYFGLSQSRQRTTLFLRIN